MQHVIGPALWDTHFQRLQACADARDGGVVVSTLFIDYGFKTALPFVQVVGDVGQEVGVTPFALAHYAVFVIAKVGGAQPHRAIFFIGVAVGDQLLDSGVDIAFFVKRGLQEVDVKLNAKGFEV